ncbi:TAXI family TRAP transporter solute-binding subunit [Streptomyces sp. AC495_CC817]|uniref:TAXI family TRAP transporter solute-binding subunit n=1 Tax=Streptomyces sp. AC495_CC817 TaxID=2823900 RepID=UPI001C27682C|nr:TAXI family TRAP transporter solute-binding subunit [Streptomyces sp. AC495_CC817]
MTRATRMLGAVVALALALGLAACDQRSADWDDGQHVIASGSETGVYFAYGSRLADALSSEIGVPFRAAQTAGSVDNLLRVDSGEALLGFAQGDAAADAVNGTGAFGEPLQIEAVARLYDEYLHIVVRGDSDIASIADLAGRRVSLGAENSGVNVIAVRVLEAAGVDPSSVDDPQLDLTGSIRAMETGEIDGFLWVGGLPTPGIEELAGKLPVRLLPVEREWVNEVNAEYSDAYRPADLPVGTYGLTASAPTMAVPNYLVTAADTPDGVVRDVLDGLFAAQPRLADDVPAGALLDRRQAIFTSPVELHPGAVEYYRDHRR